MPTQSELDQLEDDLSNLQAVMIAALLEQWLATVVPNPTDAVEDLQAIVTELVREFGLAAAAVAVDFYDSVRPDGAPSFTASASLADDLLLPGTLNWSTQPLLTDDWQDALDRTASSIQKAVKQSLVDNIGEATEADPLDAKFARWPGNPDPCAWCVLRASRGAIYWSEATAERGDHLKCGCRVTPIFPGDPLPYQRKPYMAQYLAGASEAEADIAAATPGKARRKALLSGMRRANGIR